LGFAGEELSDDDPSSSKQEDRGRLQYRIEHASTLDLDGMHISVQDPKGNNIIPLSSMLILARLLILSKPRFMINRVFPKINNACPIKKTTQRRQQESARLQGPRQVDAAIGANGN